MHDSDYFDGFNDGLLLAITALKFRDVKIAYRNFSSMALDKHDVIQQNLKHLKKQIKELNAMESASRKITGGNHGTTD